MKELIKYFVNLLILQYRNKPKAKATIETLAEHTFSDSQGNIFPLEVQGSYSLDTAVGKQLDTIGKYIGYDRVLQFPVNDNFVYAEYDGSSNPENGYSDYYQETETFPYAEYRYTSYEYYNVTDDTYRKLLKMISYLKNKPLSLGNIDEALKYAFDDLIYVVEGDKSIEYHILVDAYPILNTQEKLEAFFSKYFPRPMGCSMSVVRDPYYINAIPHGGAENYVDGLIFERSSSDYNVFFETPTKFNFKAMEYPVFHTLKIKARIKIIDTESIYSAGYWTTLNGDTYSNSNMKDLCLVKAVTYFSMITNSVRRDIIGNSNYGGKWTDITLELDHEKYGTYTIWAIVECEGVETQTVNTMYSTPDWNNFPLLWGIAGSVSLYPSGLNGAIDFKGCSVEIDGEVKWKGYTNKRIQGV